MNARVQCSAEVCASCLQVLPESVPPRNLPLFTHDGYGGRDGIVSVLMRSLIVVVSTNIIFKSYWSTLTLTHDCVLMKLRMMRGHKSILIGWCRDAVLQVLSSHQT